MKKVLISIIKTYQAFSKNIIQNNALPVLITPQCRFYPTCSDYTIEAINQYGVVRGSAKGIVRILKCNPLTSVHQHNL